MVSRLHRAMRPPEEITSSPLPSQNDTVRGLMANQGQAILLAMLQSSDNEGIQREAEHEARMTRARTHSVGQWQLDYSSGSLRLTFVESLHLPDHVKHVATCSSTTLAALFGEICLSK